MAKRKDFSNGYIEHFNPEPTRFVISANFHRLLLYIAFIAFIKIFDVKNYGNVINFATIYIVANLLHSLLVSRTIYYIITSRSVNISYPNYFYLKRKRHRPFFQRYRPDEVEFVYDYRFLSIVSILNFNLLGKHSKEFLFGKRIGIDIDYNENRENFKYYTKKSNFLFPRHLTIGMNLRNTLFGVKEMDRLSQLLMHMKLRS